MLIAKLAHDCNLNKSQALTESSAVAAKAQTCEYQLESIIDQQLEAS